MRLELSVPRVPCPQSTASSAASCGPVGRLVEVGVSGQRAACTRLVTSRVVRIRLTWALTVLVAYDDRGGAAAVTVWSAGSGRPGLLEPMGVHRHHRRHGYGTAITLAAAAALRELGSSSAIVCTQSSNEGAVATYGAAGFRRCPEVRDLCREA